MADRKIPCAIDFGRHYSSTMAQPMGSYKNFLNGHEDKKNPFNYRTVMGFYLPEWQRGLVWSIEQKISFIESAWLGVSLGTFTYNQTALESPYDNLLIDGQQRMSAIESYIKNEFEVFGFVWDETTEVDKRFWSMSTIFASYVTNSEDESYLKNYYNLMNFGGTAHKDTDRA